MRFGVLPIIALFWGLSLADKHDYCACQYVHGSKLDSAATALVAGDCTLGYVYGQLAGQYWVAQSSGPGPRHEGIYLKAAKGRIDGRHVFNSCKKYGARESTCFSCEQPLENKDGSIQCFSPRS
ncbi:hypothetical protein IAQ61_011541 [Plenodomus lingam]|uniref:uncharacterized protein n=1 Tax=Leptosphaeria maculans TaxID=5022 RepID=UPI0033348FC7|nr:hypothetical protein IAQ61_011541 [Plenodomus lingam]